MALLGESLVEEWLNRMGFFTIRGLKQGVSEIDLLAIKCSEASGTPEAWHVEAQVSFNPISYITPLSDAMARRLGKRTSARTRTPAELKECVASWVQRKFRAKRKELARESLWPGASWSLVLVHGVVKHREELKAISHQGIRLISLDEVLCDLCGRPAPAFVGAAGGDLADLIRFYADHQAASGQTHGRVVRQVARVQPDTRL